MMKKILWMVIGLLCWAQTTSAQTVIAGDMNFDGVLDVADVSSLVSTILGDKAQIIIKIDTTTAKPKTYTVNGVSFKMIPVAGGTFQMGTTVEQDSDAVRDESPVHSVTLSDYYIGETEVTQALWYAVMGAKPTSDVYQWLSICGLGDDYPAYYISWNECQKFITKLNELTGETFRMPTEAEWEYAARGGAKSQGYKYSGSNTVDDVAWYFGNSDHSTHTVATKLPNELGLYDMTGNVGEWCADWYGDYSSDAQTNPTGPDTGSDRVIRGSSYHGTYLDCRVLSRNYHIPDGCYTFQGMRLAK